MLDPAKLEIRMSSLLRGKLQGSLLTGCFSLLLSASSFGQITYQIDPAVSRVEIHLKRSGLLRFLGDEHFIDAPIARGAIVYFPDNPENSTVEVDIRAGELNVLDPHLDPRDRREVQDTMESSRVLHVEQYPRIYFRSRAVKELPDNQLEVVGDLELLGRKREVLLTATLSTEKGVLEADGRCRLKQSDFGIRPVTAGAGTVRVKDEMQLRFHITAVRAD
jgi:polyisoprenoid-binding protein YceI